MQDLTALLSAALHRRRALLAELGEHTTAVRLLHGATEGAPGVAIDRYGQALLVQTWREPIDADLLPRLAELASDAVDAPLQPVWNHRARGAPPYHETSPAPALDDTTGLELGLRYDLSVRHRGRDPLLFLDFRAARRRVRAEAEGRTVLNTFAYTCGIGVAAMAGGARQVLNVDFAASALEVGQRNAALNGLSEGFDVLREDCIPVLRLLADLPLRTRRGRRLRPPDVQPRAFDLVVLDPPRWATSKWGAVDLVNDYQSLFKPALLATAPGGSMLVANNVASVDIDDWTDALVRCAHKAGRPLLEIERMSPEPDFPSPDGRHPLKMLWLSV